MSVLQSSSREAALRWIAVAVAALAGLLLFGFMFGFDLPLAKAAFWSLPKGDMIPMTGGYEAFVRQPWGLPLTEVAGLTPTPVSIVYTDSIPWLSVALKASGLGPGLNPLGVFLLLSYPLQALGMISLLRALDVRAALPLLVGGLMALLIPAWIARQFGHIALSGHWVILLALALSVASARDGLRPWRVAGFAALAALTTGVHAYHLIPVAACFGAALLSELAQHRAAALRRVVVAAVVVLAAVAVSAALLGYFEPGEAGGGAEALGYFSMNVLGPVWPRGSLLLGQVWNGVWFAKTYEPVPGQLFEGFQYLGGGVLVLTVLMLGGLALGLARGRGPDAPRLARWAPLAAAMVVLTLWAIGWNVYVGPWQVAALPKPGGRLAEMFGVFRAHGRFFWAAGYLITALAIAWASRAPARVATPLLLAALALQAYDTSPVRQGVRSVFAAPDGYGYPKALAAAPAVRGRPWTFSPTYFCTPMAGDQRTISQMALLAARTGGTSNTFPTARNRDAACDQPRPELTTDAAPGDRRITVVMSNGQGEGGFLQPISGRADCYRIGRGVMCGRDLDGVAGLTRLAPGEVAEGSRAVISTVRFDTAAKSPALVSGWAPLDPDGQGVWSLGHQAVVALDTPAGIKSRGLTVEIIAIGFSDAPIRPQRVGVVVNGQAVGKLSVEPGLFDSYRFDVPRSALVPGQPMRIRFDLPDARISSDPRMLGIALQRIRVLN